MNYRLLYTLIYFIVISACKNKYGYREEHPYSLQIIDFVVEDSIPSASGIAVFEDSAYIIGDDASYIYKMSMSTRGYRKILLPGTDTTIYRIPKDVKHDYESAVIVSINADHYLLTFGSGTLSPYRDSLLFFNLKDEGAIRKVSLASFYSHIAQQNKLDKKDFNIEGATIAGNFLYLFNRSNGLIFQVNWPEFFQYINGSAPKDIPELYTHKIELPKSDSVQAGFSGACTLDNKTILFTASMEDTKNWVDDGEIKGSYIGRLDIISPQEIRLNTGLLVQDSANRTAFKIKSSSIKLESLDVASETPASITIKAVADNDDGTSSFYLLFLGKK